MKKKRRKETDEIKDVLKTQMPKETAIPLKDRLSTGSTQLNLAMTGNTLGGWCKGLYHLVVGDSDSGKTWLVLTALAEAANNPEFDDYQLVLDQPERGAHMDITRYFGQKLADRIRPPSGTQDDPEHSETLDDFYDNVEREVNDGPCIYILDGMDPLESAEEKALDAKKKAQRQKGKKVKGSYATNKPKENSKRLRPICNMLQKNGSILVIISQTRLNIGFTAMVNPKVRSGGEAMHFYNRLEMWMSIRERLKNPKHKNRQIGTRSKVKIVKNHICGWEGYIYITHLRGYGIDDVGDNIDFLTEHHWNVKKGRIDATEFDFEGYKEDLVEKIQADGLEKKLRILVGRVWHKIEKQIKMVRKKRYE